VFQWCLRLIIRHHCSEEEAERAEKEDPGVGVGETRVPERRDQETSGSQTASEVPERSPDPPLHFRVEVGVGVGHGSLAHLLSLEMHAPHDQVGHASSARSEERVLGKARVELGRLH